MPKPTIQKRRLIMANWFKKSQNFQYETPEEPEAEMQTPQQPVRYRLMFPIDIFFTPTGNEEQDQDGVYNIMRSILDKGAAASNDMPGFSGWTDYLQLSDVKTHNQVMKEEGLGGWG